MGNRENDRKSTLMMVSAMLIFGTIGIFRRYIPSSSGFLAFSRGFLGGIFLLIFIKFFKKEADEKVNPRAFKLLIFTGILMGINWILLFEAYNYTTVAIATLCYYMQPTIVMLLSPLIFREPLTKKKSLCALVAIIGMVLVSGVIGETGSGAGNMTGVILGLCSAVFYASVVIINKKIEGVNAYKRVMVQLFSAGTVMIPYLLLTGGFASEEFTATAVILLLVVGIFHTGFAYVLYFGSLEKLKVQSVALLSYIDPVSALVFSAVILGESLSIYGIIGAVLIIGSAVISELHPAAAEA